MFCKYCGNELPEGANFCSRCGGDQNAPMQSAAAPQGSSINFDDVKENVQKVFNTITGDNTKNVITFRELFSEIFKKHSKEDQDALMVSGTGAAGLPQYREWRKPWLFSRVLLVLGACFFILYLCWTLFQQTAGNIIPGLIFIGSMAIPFSLMLFFWETNKPRNISLFDVAKVFFVGGALSLLLTFVLQPLFDGILSWGVGGSIVLALVIGISEETAKALTAGLFLRQLRSGYILNGLLIGAAVGAGFAVFETAGYAMRMSSMEQAIQILFVRGGLSVGGHVVWTAIAGAALMAMRRPGQPLRLGDIGNSRFFMLYAVPVLLHALWDFFCFEVWNESLQYVLLGLLIVAAWVFIVKLINRGFKEEAAISAAMAAQAAAADLSSAGEQTPPPEQPQA